MTSRKVDYYDMLEKKCKDLYGYLFGTGLNAQVPRRYDWHGNPESGQGGQSSPFMMRGL